MKNHSAKKLKRINEYREKIQNYRERIERIEANPDYDERPDIKSMRVRNCQRNIQDLEGRIRCIEGNPPPVNPSKRKKKKKTASRSYSSGGRVRSSRPFTPYTYTNIRNPYSGGRCTPR